MRAHIVTLKKKITAPFSISITFSDIEIAYVGMCQTADAPLQFQRFGNYPAIRPVSPIYPQLFNNQQSIRRVGLNQATECLCEISYRHTPLCSSDSRSYTNPSTLECANKCENKGLSIVEKICTFRT